MSGQPQQQKQPQQPQTLQTKVSKAKSVEWYANQLASEAVSKEKEGHIEEAIANYLKAADILLLLAKRQDDYPTWKRYTDSANMCQQRVKQLIAARRD